MSRYITIKEQKEAFDKAPQREFPTVDAEIPQFGKIKSDVDLVWMNCLTGKNGFSLRYTLATHPSIRYKREYLPAYEDLCSFEQAIGESRLTSFAQGTPFVLHRMGYFRSYGTRDITAFARDGTIDIVAYSLDGKGEVDRKCFKKEHNPDQALIGRFKVVFRETPSALFLLYRPGTKVDFALYTMLFDSMLYKTVKDQLKNVDIPPEQLKNVQLLAFLETMDNNDLLASTPINSSTTSSGVSLETTWRRSFNYRLEDDPAEYWIFANGYFIGFNNSRAIHSYLIELEKKMPGAVVLVHRIGSDLDFGLVDKLR